MLFLNSRLHKVLSERGHDAFYQEVEQDRIWELPLASRGAPSQQGLTLDALI